MVVPTNEELAIARETVRLVKQYRRIRIQELKILTEPDNYEIVESKIIRVEFVELGKVREFTIGGDKGSDVLNNKISINSPLAIAVKDKIPGDEVTYYSESGRKVVIRLLNNSN